MSVKMYKKKDSKKVKGINVQAHLDTGWTFEPVASRPRYNKNRIKVKEAVIIKPKDLSGPEDLNEEQ